MINDKRRFKRYNYPLEVEYSPSGDGMLYSRSITKNISKGGMCMNVLSRLVRKGAPILIEIYSKGLRKNPVSLKGIVAWTKEAPDLASSLTSDTEAGIEFTGPASEELESLLQSAA